MSDDSERPSKTIKTHVDKGNKHKNDNETTDNPRRKKLRHNQVGGGDHLLSDQQLLEIENKGQSDKSMHPGFKKGLQHG